MRDAFAKEIAVLGGEESKLVLLSGDIGNRLFDPFKNKYPERFFNCGVAEANMIGMAAGMALGGLRPVAYTINSFITTRCYEQIRIDLCYHNVPVVLVGVGAGLGYASLGPTHHSCEDIAIMRVLPNMTVVCPGDPMEVKLAIREAMHAKGPTYIRIGKKGEPVVHPSAPAFKIGKALPIKEGKDVCLLSTGVLLPLAIETAKKLEAQKISATVVSFHTVKPLDTAYLKEAFAKYPVVATIEEHSRLAGFGSSIAEWLVDQAPSRARLLRFGTEDRFLHEAGEQEHAHEVFGLTSDAIAAKVKAAFSQKA